MMGAMSRLRTSRGEIQQRLRAALGTWWPPGTRLPPTKLLAQWLGTGQRNTHEALKALAREGYLECRPGAGTRVRRVPLDAPEDSEPEVSRRQTAGTAHCVRVLCADPAANQEALALVGSRLRDAGVRAEQQRYEPTSNDLRACFDRDVQGYVLLFPDYYSPVRFDERSSLVVIPSTMVIPMHAVRGFDMVSVDDTQAGVLAGRHARQVGSTRPCFVGHADPVSDEQYDQTSDIRLRAFEEGFGERIPETRRLTTARYGTGSGARVAPLFAQVRPRPDFVFAVCDEVAIGFMMGASALGLEAGRDYQLLGFDGQPVGHRIEGGPLSSIQRPVNEMLELAVHYLLDRLEHPDRIPRRTTLGATLFEGRTTGRPLKDPQAVAALP